MSNHSLAGSIATCGGIGHLPVAPGTWASLAALPAGWLLARYGGDGALLCAIMIVFGVGIWSGDRYARDRGVADPSVVVIDEVAGQWIALLGVPVHLGAYIAAFVLFRFFDIVKPWPVRWIDRHVKGGFGIMADDAVAGLFALMVLQGGLILWRAVMG